MKNIKDVTPPAVLVTEKLPLVTVENLRNDPQMRAFLERANEQMKLLGFTEHGHRHASLVGSISRNILERLGYPARVTQLAEIAGFLHDSGNLIHRDNHPHSGALMAMQILDRLGMPYDEIAIVMGAIGNHEENHGDPVGEVSAAVIIADKSDVHRSRVRNPKTTSFDIHARVNYAATSAEIKVSRRDKRITLQLAIDTSVAPLMEYFEIFLSRMSLSRKAAEFLHCAFALVINDTRLL